MNRYTRGHSIDIYKHQGRDYSNGGTTSRTDGARVVAVLIDTGGTRGYRLHYETVAREVISSAVFDVSADAPPMALVWRLRFKNWILIDCKGTDDGHLLVPTSQMFGGTYGVGSGNWYRVVGHPAAVHDRHEGDFAWQQVHR